MTPQRCSVLIVVTCLLASLPRAIPAQAISITWDRATLRYLAVGGYPRMTRLKSGVILLSCDAKGSLVRRSRDNGATWDEPIVAATFDHGHCANAELLQLDNGHVWLLYNERPEDHKH